MSTRGATPGGRRSAAARRRGRFGRTATSTGRRDLILAVGLIASLLLAHLLSGPVGLLTRAPTLGEGPTGTASFPLTGRLIKGDYGSPLQRSTAGSPIPVIDAAATIRALRSAHINTYAYLINPDQEADPRASRAQLEQLPEFAERAGAADIDVFVYLVPPTEAPEKAYQPFGWDYVAWFDHIGRLAARSPSIKGIILDDFGGNLVSRPSLGFHFTVPYVEQMTAAARRHVPGLTFLPVLYHHDLIARHAVLSDYRHLVQGVVFPYFGYSDGRRVRGNTRDASKAYLQGLEASSVLRCPSRTGCRQVVLPARTSSDASTDQAVLSSRVVPLPGLRRTLTVSVNDDAGSLVRSNYQLQVLVNGSPVSTVNRGLGWNERVFDITAATAGTTEVLLELRVTRPGGSARDRVTVQLSDLSVHGMRSDSSFAQPARTSAGVTSSPISDIPLVYMPYAIPLSAEQGHGASPAYFESVLTQVDSLRRQGRIAGVLVFKLPLEPSVLGAPNPSYETVVRRYAQW